MALVFLVLSIVWAALSQHPHMHNDIYVAWVYFIVGFMFLLTPSK